MTDMGLYLLMLKKNSITCLGSLKLFDKVFDDYSNSNGHDKECLKLLK